MNRLCRRPFVRSCHRLVPLLITALGAVGCGDKARQPPHGAGRQRPEAPAARGRPARATPTKIRLVEAASESGVDFRHQNGRSAEFFFVEPMSSGCAFLDGDRDGDQDLLMLGGLDLSAAGTSGPGSSKYYVNDGRGRFSDATARAGLAGHGYAMGACAGDYDNDGDVDLYVTRFDAQNALYQNDGSGCFTDVGAAAGVGGGPAFDASAAFGDVDGDGWLDLVVANYCDHAIANNQVCQVKRRDSGELLRRYCPPMKFAPMRPQLFRNLGNGKFADVSEAYGLSKVSGRALGVAFSDFDDDGDLDLFFSCDRTANIYLENDGGKRFVAPEIPNDTLLSKQGVEQGGMGLATGDWNNDGRIDLAVTYFEQEANGLYRNEGAHDFFVASAAAGIDAPSYALMGWGTEFSDFDLDGDLDWIVANGHLNDDVALFRDIIAPYAQPILLHENLGNGTFDTLADDGGPALAGSHVGRGLAVADVDGDGDGDVLMTVLHDAPVLLRNDSDRGSNHWLAVRTVGTASNRDGIGARVKIRAGGASQVREIVSGQSYLSQSELLARFGLGAAATVESVEVRWPSKRVTRIENVAVDQLLTITEG